MCIEQRNLLDDLILDSTLNKKGTVSIFYIHICKILSLRHTPKAGISNTVLVSIVSSFIGTREIVFFLE